MRLFRRPLSKVRENMIADLNKNCKQMLECLRCGQQECPRSTPAASLASVLYRKTRRRVLEPKAVEQITVSAVLNGSSPLATAR